VVAIELEGSTNLILRGALATVDILAWKGYKDIVDLRIGEYEVYDVSVR
jgi:hypothetical protein